MKQTDELLKAIFGFAIIALIYILACIVEAKFLSTL